MSFSIGNNLIKCIKPANTDWEQPGLLWVVVVFWVLFVVGLGFFLPSLKLSFFKKKNNLGTSISNNLQQSFHWAEANEIQLFKSHSSTS